MRENNKKKALKDMSEHELLEEMVRSNRSKQTFYIVLAVLAVAVMAAVIISLSILVPRIIASLENIEQLSAEISTFLTQAETSLNEVNKIDFDTLNQAITDFSKVVGSLAKWFK